jgi:hypothetical protein
MMKLNLHLDNVQGIYFEENALKLSPSRFIQEEDFICFITNSQYDRMRAAFMRSQTEGYTEIENVINETKIDIPLWLLYEKGLGDEHPKILS